MTNHNMLRLLAIVLSFFLLTGARADIAGDVAAGLPLQQVASNALAGSSPAEVVARMIAAGVNPILAAEAVARVSPPAAAPGIAAAAAAAVPEAAADIAATVASVVPTQAVTIALAVERTPAVASRVPSMAPQIAALVAQAVPDQAVDVAVAMARTAPAQANQIADSVAAAVPEAAAAVRLAVNAAGGGGGQPGVTSLGVQSIQNLGGVGGAGGSIGQRCATQGAVTPWTRTGIFRDDGIRTEDYSKCAGNSVEKRQKRWQKNDEWMKQGRCELVLPPTLNWVIYYEWQPSNREEYIGDFLVSTALCPTPMVCGGSPPACVCPPPTSPDGKGGCK